MAEESKMKTLILALETIFNAEITAGNVDFKKVFVGLQDAPAQAANTEYPYLMIDEGGERGDMDMADSTNAEVRIYPIVFEFGTYNLENIRAALLEILDLSAQAKTVIQANQQPIGTDEVDGIIWGLNITPFGWASENTFFRGRQVIVEYTLLEDTPEQL